VSAGAARRILLFCVGKRTRKGCDRGSKVGIVHSVRDWEGPVPSRGNRRNLAKEGVMRKISYPRTEAGVPNLSNEHGQRAGNMGKGECCSCFGERTRYFITEKSRMTGDPPEA